MEINVYAEQFTNGRWDLWEHACTTKEADAVVDYAHVRANVRASGRPVHSDFLEGARCVFNVARGPANSPWEGDTRVYCVCVDEVVIGVYEKIRHYSRQAAEARGFFEVPLQKSA